MIQLHKGSSVRIQPGSCICAWRIILTCSKVWWLYGGIELCLNFSKLGLKRYRKREPSLNIYKSEPSGVDLENVMVGKKKRIENGQD